MDVVYPLGFESLSDDDELRFSLRSLERNMRDLGNVYIYGQLPDWIKNVVHVPMPDDNADPRVNVRRKILSAANNPAISTDFLLMADDIFALRSFSGEELPFYATSKGVGSIMNPLRYTLHLPIRYNREFYAKMPFPEPPPSGHSPRDFYCNFYSAPATPATDCIIKEGAQSAPFDDQIKGRDFCVIGNTIMTNELFRLWLLKMFPTPSRFECD
jgi:hypothetical protein